jgi:hypothetical protein
MKCPHCSKEIPGKECPHCNTVIPAESRYCIECGIDMEGTPEDIEVEDSDPDFENRVLCPDGTCTGIIIDSRCCECGKSA